MCIGTPSVTMLSVFVTLLFVLGYTHSISPAALSARPRPLNRKLFSSSVLAYAPPHAIAKALLSVLKDSASKENVVKRVTVRK